MAGKDDDALQPGGDPVGLAQLDEATLVSFASDRDGFLTEELPASLLPQGEDEFVARDLFSSDYVEFLYRKRDVNEAVRGVNKGLRESLLEKPHLMEKPEEGAHRGAAAVWRSLRDQLHEETLQKIDASGREELLLMRSELELRRAVVESVGAGMGDLLKRLDDRVAAIDAGEVADIPAAAAPAADGS